MEETKETMLLEEVRNKLYDNLEILNLVIQSLSDNLDGKMYVACALNVMKRDLKESIIKEIETSIDL